MDIFGIPLALDIGTFFGLLATGATAAGLTRWLRGRWRRDEELRREEEARAAEVYRTQKEALEIHESLTTVTVFEALERARASESDVVAREFLLAAYRRGNRRYRAFQDSTQLAPELEELVDQALRGIAQAFPAELRQEQAAFVAKQQRRLNDRSRYLWDDGSGPHSKIWTINLIAQRWAEQHPTRPDFEESFGAELRTAVGDRADEFDPRWLLVREGDRSYRPSDTYLPSLVVRLDGVPYGIHWRCGFKDTQIGVSIHKPIIEHFRSVHRYPITPA